MKKVFLILGFILSSLLLASGLISSTAGAETVLMEDSVNRENLALQTDRLFHDSCSKLLDCKKGVMPVNITSNYTSYQAKALGTLTDSTLNTANMQARFAGQVNTTSYAPIANNAVWTNSYSALGANVTAFQASSYSGNILVRDAIRAESAYVVDQAKVNASTTALYAFWCSVDPGTCVQQNTTKYLKGSGNALVIDKSTYTRNAINYNSKAFYAPWTATVGGDGASTLYTIQW